MLVLETVGSIDNFVNAIRRIPGLEWLGEFDHEPFDPEHGFEDEDNPEKELSGQLFLIMTDQQAQAQMVSLFQGWDRDGDAKFPFGLAKLRDAFVNLHTIRPWDSQDRIRDTGILDDWQDRIESGDEIIPFEAEMWFRSNPLLREQAESYLREILESLGGEIVQQCVIPEIAYHSILGRIPRAHVQEIVNQPDAHQNIRLLQCEGVRHMRPVGQCAIRLDEDVLDTLLQEEVQGEDRPDGDPLVALLDGLPLAGHRRLDGRITIDDPDGYEGSYQARERFHGTTMASLICHGDLNASGNPIGRPIYV